MFSSLSQHSDDRMCVSPSFNFVRGCISVLILIIGINGKFKMASLDSSRDARGDVGNESGFELNISIDRLCND